MNDPRPWRIIGVRGDYALISRTPLDDDLTVQSAALVSLSGNHPDCRINAHVALKHGKRVAPANLLHMRDAALFTRAEQVVDVGH